jgi:hypothetical protein
VGNLDQRQTRPDGDRIPAVFGCEHFRSDTCLLQDFAPERALEVDALADNVCAFD